MKNGQRYFEITIILLTVLCSVSSGYAHAPHDVVHEVIISPNFSQDHTIYSLERMNLLKSVDGNQIWKRLINGLDNVSPLTSVAIDSAFANILYLATGLEGIYKTDTAGVSWYKFNQGLDNLKIAKVYVASNSSKKGVVFAISKLNSLYRAEYNTWVKVFTHSLPITAISSLAQGQKILIGDQNGGLFVSSDAGFSYSKLYDFSSCGEISAIGTLDDIELNNVFFVGTSQCGVFYTNDAGISFVKRQTGIIELNIRAISLSPSFANDTTVLVSTANQAIFVSKDSGKDWKQHKYGLTTTGQGKDHQFGQIKVSPNFAKDKIVLLAGVDGLFKSRTGGIYWKELNTMPVTLIQSLAVSPNYLNDKTLALTTYVDGIYLSKDDGVTWQRVAENVAARNDDIIFSPSYARDGTIFASMGMSIGQPTHVAKSSDNGQTWVAPQAYEGGGWATILAISPNFINDKTLFVVDRKAHIHKSIDGGLSYTDIYNEGGLDCAYCSSSLVISPNFLQDETLLVATLNGVHISNDSGKTWLAKGLNNTFGLHAKAAFSPNYAKDNIVFIAGEKGLFCSKDGFNTWRKVSDVNRGVDGWVQELAVSPNFENDKTIIISVKGKGLFKSQDQGGTFQPLGVKLIKTNNSAGLWEGFPVATASAIRFSPAYATDKIIFINTSDRIFRSKDGGKTWLPLVNNLRFGQRFRTL